MARVIESRARRGLATPLDRRPEILPAWSWVWDAFVDLCRQRPRGLMACEPIPPTHVLAWLDIHGIEDVDQRAVLFRLIVSMDCKWRAEMATQAS